MLLVSSKLESEDHLTANLLLHTMDFDRKQHWIGREDTTHAPNSVLISNFSSLYVPLDGQTKASLLISMSDVRNHTDEGAVIGMHSFRSLVNNRNECILITCDLSPLIPLGEHWDRAFYTHNRSIELQA